MASDPVHGDGGLHERLYAVDVVDGQRRVSDVVGRQHLRHGGCGGEPRSRSPARRRWRRPRSMASQDATNVASITFPVTGARQPEPSLEPEPVSNQIEAKHQDVAYPVITAAIALGAGEDEMLTPGEAVELMGSDLFTVMDGYDATYRVSVDSAAVSGLADRATASLSRRFRPAMPRSRSPARRR